MAKVAGTAISTGVHPIVTGVPGRNTTVPVISSSTRPVIPVSSHASSAVQSSAVQSSAVESTAAQPTATQPGGVQPGGVQPGGAQPSGAQPSGAQPSPSGFVPSNPGAKVTVPMVGAALGSVAYGALVFLA
jgi:hypothetical protein